MKVTFKSLWPAAFLALMGSIIAPAQTAPVAPTFTQTNLVSNVPGNAKTMDPNLVNPFGCAVHHADTPSRATDTFSRPVLTCKKHAQHVLFLVLRSFECAVVL